MPAGVFRNPWTHLPRIPICRVLPSPAGRAHVRCVWRNAIHQMLNRAPVGTTCLTACAAPALGSGPSGDTPQPQVQWAFHGRKRTSGHLDGSREINWALSDRDACHRGFRVRPRGRRCVRTDVPTSTRASTRCSPSRRNYDSVGAGSAVPLAALNVCSGAGNARDRTSAAYWTAASDIAAPSFA